MRTKKEKTEQQLKKLVETTKKDDYETKVSCHGEMCGTILFWDGCCGKFSIIIERYKVTYY